MASLSTNPPAFAVLRLRANPMDKNVALDPALANRSGAGHVPVFNRGKEYEDMTLEKLRKLEREKMRNEILEQDSRD